MSENDMITSNERNVFMKSEFKEKKLHLFEGRISACFWREQLQNYLPSTELKKNVRSVMYFSEKNTKVVFFWILLP